MKKVVSMMLAGAMLGSCVAMAAEEEKAVTVKVDGVALAIEDQQPIIEENRTLVPLRAIFEALEAEVAWDDATRTVTAKKGEIEMELKIGAEKYTVNGEEKELDVPAKIMNNRTLVPLNVVAESLGCAANWDGEKYIVDVATPAHQAVVAEADRIRAIEPTIDGSYKTVEGIRLPVKMYIPEEKTENSKIAVLAIHGGGWYAVSKDSDTWNGSWMNYQAQYYYDKYGYTTAAVSYRNIKLTETTNVMEQVEDCKDAVKYMRENAEFDKLIIMGDSSGGHLATMLGLDDEVNADIVVAANPVLDLNTEKWAYTAAEEEIRIQASPLYNPKKTDTKFLVMHGNSDTTVDYSTSKKFCEDMQALGTQCDYMELDGVKHAFILSRYQSTDEMVNEFMDMIDKYLAENLFETEEATEEKVVTEEATEEEAVSDETTTDETTEEEAVTEEETATEEETTEAETETAEDEK